MVSDAVLVERVIAGFDDAFDELYRRHAQAAWRLGQAVTGNVHDAADAVSEAFARVLKAVRAGRLADGGAFRPYLLAATRNAALDGLRTKGRTQPSDDLEVEASSPTPADAAAHVADAALVAEAFRNLPERWRSVLWLTEVEGIAPKDAADQLGLSANGTAQLAVRARKGLRERYLQAHVKAGDVAPACRFTVEHLGAYVGGAISPRDLAKVDQHLAGCPECRARAAELEDLGTPLRHLALPIPLALGALSAERVHAVLTASTSTLPTGSLAARAIQLAKEPTPFMRKAAGVSAAGVLALGLLALPFASSNKGVPGFAESQGSAQSAPAVAELPAAAPIDTTSGSAYSLDASTMSRGSNGRLAFSAPGATTPTTTPAKKKAPAQQSPAATKPDEPANPLAPITDLLSPITDPLLPSGVDSLPANVGVNLGGHDLGVGAVLGATPAVGVEADDQVIGTTDPATPTTPGVVVQVGPIAVPIPLG
jgi:RNA polymerase sigma factor (sigma-70 family)